MKKSNFLKLFICFFILLIINSLFIFRNPWFDWDIVSYIGNVKYIENKDREEVHKETYEELKNYLDPGRYKIILEANQYRKDVYKETDSFFDIMPFYNIKFIYIYSTYFFTKLGFGIIDAILAVSILSYLGFSIILFLIFKREIEKFPVLFFALYLMTFSSPIIIAARSTTPDMFGAFLLLAGTFLIIRKNIILGLLVLILSLGVRTDSIIFIGVLMFYLKFFANNEYKINYKTFFIGGISALLFYKGINTYFHNFGYWTLYYNSFIEPISYPSTFDMSVSLREYFVIFKDKMATLIALRENKPVTFFPFYVILSIIAFVLAQKNKVKYSNIYLGLLIVSTFTLLFKFAIFPNIQERYFVFHFIITFIVLVKFGLGEEIESERRRKISD